MLKLNLRAFIVLITCIGALLTSPKSSSATVLSESCILCGQQEQICLYSREQMCTMLCPYYNGDSVCLGWGTDFCGGEPSWRIWCGSDVTGPNP